MRRLWGWIGGAAALAGTAALTLLYSGAYDVAATSKHWQPVYRLLDIGMRESVARRAARLQVPPLDDERLVARGLAHYRRHCVPCHGAPGVAPEAFALGMAPAPANLSHTARAWPPAQLFWVLKFGIKMSGMPAWQMHLDDDQMWAVVAFLQRLPALSPRQYQALQASEPDREDSDDDTRRTDDGAPDPGRGLLAIGQYACATCHRIPGVRGAHAPVGPPLDGIGRRKLIAGRLANTPDHMVRWLRAPQAVKPGSAMPDLGLREREARDIAAYLATLD
jgi:mono/diheme cytochrome c family protein